MNRKVIYLIIGVIVSISFCFVFIGYRNNEDRLFARFKEQIRNGKIEDLYAESSESVKISLTEKQFFEKMREVASKMRQIDENLNFQRDKGWEQTTPQGAPKEYGYRFTVQRLENKDASAFVIIFWDDQGIFPKFQNIIIGQSDDPNNKWSKEYEFKGI